MQVLSMLLSATLRKNQEQLGPTGKGQYAGGWWILKRLMLYFRDHLSAAAHSTCSRPSTALSAWALNVVWWSLQGNSQQGRIVDMHQTCL